jgi:hypothetical protein
MLSTAEVARLKGVCSRTVLAAVERGDLRPAIRGGGRRGFRFEACVARAWTPRCELPRYRYRDDYLVALLGRARRELGHTPSRREWDALGGDYPHSATLSRRFGSWGAAIRTLDMAAESS